MCVTDGAARFQYSAGHARRGSESGPIPSADHIGKGVDPMSGIDTLVRAASALGGRIAAAHRRRQTMLVLDGLPDYMLKDIGYSRDWRGAPRRMPHGFKL